MRWVEMKMEERKSFVRADVLVDLGPIVDIEMNFESTCCLPVCVRSIVHECMRTRLRSLLKLPKEINCEMDCVCECRREAEAKKESITRSHYMQR